MSSRLESETRAATYTAAEMMTIAAARALPNGATCLVGIGLPGTAAILARRVHAPELVLVYESGPIGAKPAYLPLSIGDGVLAETADTVVSLSHRRLKPEMLALHRAGWTHYLRRLALVAAGRDPGRDPWRDMAISEDEMRAAGLLPH